MPNLSSSSLRNPDPLEGHSHPWGQELPSSEDILDALAALFTQPEAERIIANLNPSLELDMEDEP